jgi:hypothetical protein
MFPVKTGVGATGKKYVIEAKSKNKPINVRTIIAVILIFFLCFWLIIESNIKNKFSNYAYF